MDEPFEIGQLYRAISATELIEFTTPAPVAGLKLLVNPENVKTLRAIQKQVRILTGEKPSFPTVLNVLLATINWEDQLQAITAKLTESGTQTSQNEK
jgi:hypothetical protein